MLGVTIKIEGIDSEFLEIWVKGRSQPWSSDYWGANWLDAEVRLKAGVFNCEYPLIIRADELKRFREAVACRNSLDSEEASSETVQRQLRVRILAAGEHYLTAECEARDRPQRHPQDHFRPANVPNASLSFARAALPEILKGLDEVVEKFPVIGEPDI